MLTSGCLATCQSLSHRIAYIHTRLLREGHRGHPQTIAVYIDWVLIRAEERVNLIDLIVEEDIYVEDLIRDILKDLVVIVVINTLFSAHFTRDLISWVMHTY